MAQLMVALIGPGCGPRVPRGGGTCVVRISGMHDGYAKIFVDNMLHKTVINNGNCDVPEGEFVSIEYEGKSRTLIAEVVRKD